MKELELNIENLLLYSYGCKLCQEKAIELFYDIDIQEAFKLYSKIFCEKCIAAKIALRYEDCKDTLIKYISKEKEKRF